MFEGRNLVIYTDHKPLTHSIVTNSKTETPRRTRYLEHIGQFTSDIRHISGKDNQVADALSRIETITCPTPINYEELAKQQAQDEDLVELKRSEKHDFRNTILPLTNTKVTCEFSSGTARPYLPRGFREAVFHATHDLSHPGIRTTRRMISSRYFWPSLKSDVINWAKGCLHCQRAKVQKHTKAPIGTFKEAERLSHVHVDIVGPLPISDGHRYLLTMIDRASKWPEAYPIKDITAETIANAIYERWISRFGCPGFITTDRGSQFESDLFNKLMHRMGIKRIHTTAYHPQANGIIERWHRSLKAALIARFNTTNWTSELPTVLLGLRAAVKEDIGKSTAELLYGQPLRLPGEFYDDSTKEYNTSSHFMHDLNNALKKAQIQRRSNQSQATFVHEDLSTASHVFVRNDAAKRPLTPNYDGPFKVTGRRDKHYTVEMKGRITNVSIDRLKPAFFVKATSDDELKTYITKSGRMSKPPVRFAGGE